MVSEAALSAPTFFASFFQRCSLDVYFPRSLEVQKVTGGDGEVRLTPRVGVLRLLRAAGVCGRLAIVSGAHFDGGCLCVVGGGRTRLAQVVRLPQVADGKLHALVAEKDAAASCLRALWEEGQGEEEDVLLSEAVLRGPGVIPRVIEGAAGVMLVGRAVVHVLGEARPDELAEAISAAGWPLSVVQVPDRDAMLALLERHGVEYRLADG